MAHPDLDTLFDDLVKLAQQLLAKYGEFFPFGAVITSAGELRHSAASNESDRPKSQELINLLTAGFRSQAAAGQIRACGICMDALVVPPKATAKSDAILCRIEHVGGETLNVYLPYKKKMLGSIQYGEVFAAKGESAVFNPPPSH